MGGLGGGSDEVSKATCHSQVTLPGACETRCESSASLQLLYLPFTAM